MLTGGPDLDPGVYGQLPHPKTYGVDRDVDDFELPLVHDAIARGIPTLAICRGVQVLNVALGGSLYQHIPDDPGTEPHGRPGEPNGGRLHDVTIDAGSRLATVMGATTVTASCHHHQAIDKVGDGLHVVARAADGIVEALELDRSGSGCSRCSGTPRTPPPPTPPSSTSSTPSSPNSASEPASTSPRYSRAK